MRHNLYEGFPFQSNFRNPVNGGKDTREPDGGKCDGSKGVVMFGLITSPEYIEALIKVIDIRILRHANFSP